MGTNLLPDRVKTIEKDLYDNEKTGEIGMCKKVNQMYRSWLVSTIILKYIFPIISAIIILLLTIIINKLSG
jgi:hypothetical protein